MTQSHGLPQPHSWSHIRDISIRTDEGAKRGTPQCQGFWHKKPFSPKIKIFRFSCRFLGRNQAHFHLIRTARIMLSSSTAIEVV
jgi:hypothetical protein